MELNGKYIVLIQNNQADSELILNSFKKHGAGDRLLALGSATEAEHYLFCKENYSDRDITDQPTVILMDLKIAETFDLLKKIRSEDDTKYLPVILLNSSTNDKDIETAYSLGANSYMRKPTPLKDFDDAAKVFAVYWLKLNITTG